MATPLFFSRFFLKLFFNKKITVELFYTFFHSLLTLSKVNNELKVPLRQLDAMGSHSDDGINEQSTQKMSWH